MRKRASEGGTVNEKVSSYISNVVNHKRSATLLYAVTIDLISVASLHFTLYFEAFRMLHCAGSVSLPAHYEVSW